MFDQLFERVGLGVLSEALLYGEMPDGQADSMSCEERLRAAECEMQQQLDDMGLEPQANEDVQEIISGYQAKISSIYFELGMRAGVKLYRALVEGMTGAIKPESVV